VESGKLELEYFDFDVRTTVEDALDSVIMPALNKVGRYRLTPVRPQDDPRLTTA
jgi:hypothetical protein